MRVRVLSYNIHRAIGVDRRFRPDRIATVLEHHDADVVLLQEVDEGVPRSRRLDLAHELASALKYPHVAVGHNVQLRRGRYGNATLSRHPIRKHRNIDLTVGRLRGRGCQHTRLVVTGPRGARRRLDTFNLHLGLSALERRRQVDRLFRAREFTGLGRSTPCVVAGDFNDWRSLLSPSFLDGHTFRSATRSGRRDRPFATYPSFFPQGALDRIFFRGRMRLLGAYRSRHRFVKVASDHLPVVADFDLT